MSIEFREPEENQIDDLIRDRSDSSMHFRKKIPVAILGATGSVGQRLIQLLAKHPWFEIVALTASDKSVGKKYREAAHWMLPSSIPENIGKLTLLETACEAVKAHGCKLVFSALTSSIAGPIEEEFASNGFAVISMASAHRMKENVPMMVPEVNLEQLELIKLQKFGNGGLIVTKPNCAVVGLATALRPLQLEFGIEKVFCVTMQSISGAGFPGVPSLSIIDNIIPDLVDEAEKLETETAKVLGSLKDGRVAPYPITVSSVCNRVPVTEGHLEIVSVKLKQAVTQEEVKRAFVEFCPPVKELQLPSSPAQAIHYFDAPNMPQPKLQRDLEKGMAVSIGCLHKCPLLDYKFVLLSHNTIRGAAGGAILTAELLVKKGYIFW